MPIALPDRPEMGLIVFRLLFWLCALTFLYWEIQLAVWACEQFSLAGILRHVGSLLRGFLGF